MKRCSLSGESLLPVLGQLPVLRKDGYCFYLGRLRQQLANRIAGKGWVTHARGSGVRWGFPEIGRKRLRLDERLREGSRGHSGNSQAEDCGKNAHWIGPTESIDDLILPPTCINSPER
jgi:hypothetical protein